MGHRNSGDTLKLRELPAEWGFAEERSRRALPRPLTFDMRGDQKAQPAGHPLDGMVRFHFSHASPYCRMNAAACSGGSLLSNAQAVKLPTIFLLTVSM